MNYEDRKTLAARTTHTETTHADTPNRAAPNGFSGQSRLRPVQFLIWGTCIGVYFGILFAPQLMRGSMARYGLWISIVDAVLNSIGAGTALFGLTLFFERRSRNIPFPDRPGEYLLLALGLRYLFLWGGQLYWFVVDFSKTGEVTMHPHGFAAAIGLLLACLLLPLGWQRAGLLWQMFIVAFVAIHTLNLLGSYLRLIDLGPLFVVVRLIPFGLLVCAVLGDINQRRRMPWTHWLGVGTQLWLHFALLVNYLLAVALHYLVTNNLL